MAGNLQRGNTLTIPLSGSQTGIFILGCDELLALAVPTLDLCTLTVSGVVDRRQPDGTFLTSGSVAPILDETGVQILTFAATTGNFVVGAKALADLSGISRIQIGASAPQNTAARTFTISQKVPDR